jgi:drug/metabolite transporter (DMT)-like permease
MVSVLAVGGAGIATADVLLFVVSWRSRTVLGVVAGVIGISLVVFAIASGLDSGAARGALAIALILLIVGAVLYGLGQAFERLLDADPEEES